MLLLKNPKILPNHYETWSKLVTHELVMEIKFRNDRVKIVDFLLIAYFWARVIFYYSVSIRF